MAHPTPTREKTINLRAPTTKKVLIDRAADSLGQSRSRFMLEASVQRAESVLADRTHFELSSAEMTRFEKALAQPLPDAEALKRLLTRRAPWSR